MWCWSSLYAECTEPLSLHARDDWWLESLWMLWRLLRRCCLSILVSRMLNICKQCSLQLGELLMQDRSVSVLCIHHVSFVRRLLYTCVNVSAVWHTMCCFCLSFFQLHYFSWNLCILYRPCPHGCATYDYPVCDSYELCVLYWMSHVWQLSDIHQFTCVPHCIGQHFAEFRQIYGHF